MKAIFIDGYNVIRSWPALKDIKEDSFESARQKLIDMIQEYAVFKDCRLTLYSMDIK